MFGSGILEVATGVIFVFLLMSLLCSALREGLEAWTKTRAAYLEYGIRELLHDRAGAGLAASFFNHPLIHGLYAGEYQPGRSDRRPGLLEKGRNLPSYVPAKSFALALMDMAARGPSTDAVSSHPAAPILSLAAVRANVLNLDNAAVQRVLLTAVDSAQGDLDTASANLEAWYDGGMERVSGWYKRSTQWVIFWLALLVVVAGNINTLTIAGYLYRNDAARAAIVERAKVAVEDPSYLERSYQQIKTDLTDMSLPIGWANGVIAGETRKAGALAAGEPMPGFLALASTISTAVFGWLLTAFAASLGAPFWFDVLAKVMVIRSTLKPQNGPRDLPATFPAALPSPPPAYVLAAPAIAAQQDVAPRDAESDVDCCENRNAERDEETPDDELPAATGGVA